MDLSKEPHRRSSGHQCVQAMPILLMGNAVLNGIDQVETSRKPEGRYRADICVTVEIEFEPKELLEEVSVGASLEWWAET